MASNKNNALKKFNGVKNNDVEDAADVRSTPLPSSAKPNPPKNKGLSDDEAGQNKPTSTVGALTVVEASEINASRGRRRRGAKPGSELLPTIEFKKAVESIHIRVTAGKLMLIGRKLFNVLLFNAQDQGVDRIRYEMPLNSLVKDYDFDGEHIGYLKDQLRRLNTTSVEWDVFSAEGKKKSWATATMISGAKIEDGKLSYSFDANIKEQLLYPATYQRINLRIISKFRSSYALALYENTIRFINNTRGAGDRAGLTTRAHWRTWASLLSGHPDEVSSSTLSFKYWRRDTLQTAIDEVNEISDIEIEATFYREGRSVSDIQFRVQKQRQAQLEFDAESPAAAELMRQMIAIGCTKSESSSVLYSHSEEDVRAALEATTKRLANKRLEQLASPGSYFMVMLRGGHAKKDEAEIEIKLIASKPDKPSKTEIGKKKLESKFHAWRTSLEKEHFGTLGKDEQNALFASFETAHIENKTLMSSIRRFGLTAKSVEAAFFSWIESTKPWDDQDLLAYALDNGMLKQ